jgi:hypothetical protein
MEISENKLLPPKEKALKLIRRKLIFALPTAIAV